ncbi:MAG TPA: lytic transglycosylase, partial [Mycobacterium sp.]|nr:lytic transglycosylase [Mycobacterium sp.]
QLAPPSAAQVPEEAPAPPPWQPPWMLPPPAAPAPEPAPAPDTETPVAPALPAPHGALPGPAD